MKTQSIFDVPAEKLNEEKFEKIFSTKNFLVERIISDGQSSPDNFWYDQPENELVFLLSGNAVIEFENEFIELNPGEYLLIPSHRKHRVVSTSKNQKTIWLAIHFHDYNIDINQT